MQTTQKEDDLNRSLWGIFLSAFYLVSLVAYPAWAVDDSTIQAIQNEVSTTKGKTDVQGAQIKSLEGGIPAERAARIAADITLQNQINNIALIPGPQGPAGQQGPPGPAYVPVTPTVSSLAGEYAVNGSRVCVYVPNIPGTSGPMQFGPPPLYALPPADPSLNYAGGGAVRSGQYYGRMILDEYGSGTWVVKLMQVNHSAVGPSQAPIYLHDVACDVNVQEGVNGSFNLLLINCVGNSSQSVPPGIPSFGPENDPLTIDVSASGDTLLLSDIQPVARLTWGFSPSTGSIFYSNRICTRSHTAVRLAPRP
jgi:hypothetical protein